MIHVFFICSDVYVESYRILRISQTNPSAKYALITTIVLFIGGLILGPIVQKYAFGCVLGRYPFWMGSRRNKLLFAFLFASAWVLVSKKLDIG
ncbi:MAG: hypothetical protein IPG53_23575 [Ignavibacteriales bacterium]|nr:hypothetical protein [Ignavibacteriales bacterium]